MIGSLLAAVLLAGTMTPREEDEVDRHVRRILADDAYGFCHDEKYPLTWSEADWCPLVQDNPRCPAFEHACEAPRAELVGPPGRLSRRTVSEKKEPEVRERGKGPDRRRATEQTEIDVPALGGIAELLFWIVVFGAVLAIVLAIAKNLARGKAPEATPEPERAAKDAQAAADAAAHRAMETDVDRLLAMANDYAARGEFADAVDFTHAALLRRLDHDGLIRLHRARTNGDYVRDLRGHAELLGPVRDALRRVDRAQFGTEPPQRSTFEDIYQRIVAIVKRAAPLALLALMVTTFGIACDEAELGRNYPWSRSPSGSDALIELLRARGFEADYRTAALQDFAPETRHGALVVVMLYEAEATDAEWDAIRQWVEDGGRLVVAGADVPSWLGVAKRRGALGQDDKRRWVADAFTSDFTVPYVVVPDYGVLEPSGGDVLLERDGEAYAVTYERGAGTVVVLADDSLFINASLPVADNAIFVEALLRDLGARVEFVDGWSGVGADDPFETIRRTHLTPAVVQLLLLILVLYLWRGVRFGTPRDPIPPSRRAFVQHAVAMGHQYGRARATGHAAAAYAGWVLERLRDRYPIAAAGGLSGLAQHVASRSRRDDTEVTRLLYEADNAAKSHGVGTPGEDLALVRDLGRLMRELSSKTEQGAQR